MIAQGDTFSGSFSVEGKVYEGFMALFGDRTPIHTDGAYARSKGFAGPVMHGNILGGFLSAFIGQALPVREVLLHRQEIRYSRPVYLGDRLTLRVRAEAVSEAVSAVEFSFGFENQDGVKVAYGRFQLGLL